MNTIHHDQPDEFEHRLSSLSIVEPPTDYYDLSKIFIEAPERHWISGWKLLTASIASISVVLAVSYQLTTLKSNDQSVGNSALNDRPANMIAGSNQVNDSDTTNDSLSQENLDSDAQSINLVSSAGPGDSVTIFEQGNLSDVVYTVLQEVFTRLGEGQLEEAKNELDALLIRFDELGSFEQLTLLNFYSDYYLLNRQIPEAISSIERLIDIDGIPRDAFIRALRTLGQLNATIDEYDSSITYYERFLEESGDRDSSVLRGLAGSYYQNEQYSEAIAPLAEHIDLLYQQGDEIDRNTLGLLNVLSIETNDYENAAWVTNIMVEQFDQMSDWRNLEAIYERLGDEAKRVQLIEDAKAAGHMDESGNWVIRNLQ